MSRPLPPLGDLASPLTCTRVGCDADATWHVIWTTDGECGLCCDEHRDEALRRWAFHTMHPYELVCSADGARFVVLPDGTSFCLHPGDPLLQDTAQAEAVPV